MLDKTDISNVRGMQFNQIIEIIDGKITKDEEVEFDDYDWDCICPNLGG